MMEYKGYLAHVASDDLANIFHGEVSIIRDVVTFQGKAVDELRQTFAESVDDYLAYCAQRGEEPDFFEACSCTRRSGARVPAAGG